MHDIAHRIRRLYGICLLLFLLLLGWQSYWQLAKSDWLFTQESNRRLSRMERNIARGVIYDREGRKLAWSQAGLRQYADAHATAGVLGYIDARYGRTGVEGEWNLELSGLSRTFTLYDLQRILANEKPHGKDLALTLDLSLQQAAEAALAGHRGAIAVIDPATGGILALATAPTFDPTRIRLQFRTLSQNDEGALRNRAVQDRYPPGSTMKVVTAAAALMHGVEPSKTYTCTGTSRAYGVTITDFHGTAHGTIDMEQALIKSCNNYFARTAAELSQDDFFTTAENFGFGMRWWEKLPDRRLLPFPIVRSSLETDMARPVSQGERAHMGFGQSTVVATPLQMAMVAGGVANRGVVMAPYLVQAVRKGGTEQVLEKYHSVPIGFPMNGDVADELAGMMRKVVAERGGTGHGANVDGITVYGKTGTAQQEGGQDHAWFIGFAERERGDRTQKIAFAVVIERGGTGGRVAVPVARQVLEAWKRQ